MAAYLSPIFGAGAQFFTNQGIILSGGKLYTYQAGTTTPLTTWTDSTQIVANANPIIADSAGRLANEIWLQASTTYKFILTDSNDNTLGTWDNIAGLNDITSSVTVSEWETTSLTPSYIDASSFSVSGDKTSTFTINRRLKLAVSAGTVYGYVVSSAFGGAVTTIVMQPDSTVLDSGLSSVNVGLISSVNTSAPQQLFAMNAPVTVASASTTPIGAALSASVYISGVVTITAFDTVLNGIIKFVGWNEATPITYNATSMRLIGAASRTNNAGDFSIFRSLGSGNWIEVVYQERSGGIHGNVVGNVTGNLAGNVTGNVNGNLTGNVTGNADTATTVTTTIASAATGTTQTAADNSTKIATTAYVDRGRDFQQFDASGTWTKPAGIDPNALIQIMAWGGGGGGSSTTTDGGGGGGFSTVVFTAAAFGATETVTIGAGGAAGNPGGVGGNTTVGSLLTAYGGGNGASGVGGGGGGGTGGAGAAGKVAGIAGVVASANGFVINEAGGSTNSATPLGRVPIYGGGCGGQSGSGYGSGSWYGGGGGSSDGATSGGLGYFGGAGGATSAAGTAPGGGGGQGAAGAKGRVIIRTLATV